MPGAFADESTGCTTGLQNCSLPKALCFRFAWLLYNFTSSLLIPWSGGGEAPRDIPSLTSPSSLLRRLGDASRLCL